MTVFHGTDANTARPAAPDAAIMMDGGFLIFYGDCVMGTDFLATSTANT